MLGTYTKYIVHYISTFYHTLIHTYNICLCTRTDSVMCVCHTVPHSYQLSGGFNRELVKQELVVELAEGSRKIRRLFLFHDVLISAKEKSARYVPVAVGVSVVVLV